jgi:outer membrane protein assembly factor BamA
MYFIKKLLLVIFLGLTGCYQSFSQDSLIVSNINLHGNDITKDQIIYRELLFCDGQYIAKSDLETLIQKSKNNLLNTSLFNFVTIGYNIDESIVKIDVDLQERWYIWPYPVLEHADRNFSSFLNNQEWSRIDYGLFVLINNFRGRMETLKLKTIFGFNKSYSLSYYKPYIDEKQKFGIGAEFNYIKNKEVAFQIMGDELQYLKLENTFGRERIDGTFYLTYRPHIYLEHLGAFQYNYTAIEDSLFSLNENYFYNDNNSIRFFSLIYNFDYDKRDSKIYPLKGFRVSSSLIKKGLGILETSGPFYIKSILENNIQLSRKFYFNTSVEGKYSFNNLNSFYFSQAIGYDNYLRGMEYYVSNGSNYYISKSNLKLELIPQTNLNLNFLQSKKFSKAHYALYVNLFMDTGYVDSNTNVTSCLSNQFLYSGGVGIDFVTYYDKVLRIEYSMNKFGEHGIFFHLGAPIIE